MFRKMLFCIFPLFIILLFLSCTRKPVTPKSGPPVINAIEASPNIVSKGGKVYLNLAATDPDEDRMYFEWSCTDGSFFSDSLLQNASNTANPCWWKAPTSEGNDTINVTCTDSIGDIPVFVDTSIIISVSIYSLDSIIGESEFNSPFAMYLDAEGKLYVTDPGLSAIHFYNGTNWIKWNYAGLDTTITTTTSYDTIDTIIPIIDTTKIIKTLIGKDLYDSPSAITVDENRNLIYIANPEITVTEISIYDMNKMFTAEDTVIALSTIVTMSQNNGVWDTLTDTLSLDTVCLYGFQFKINDNTFPIKAPYSFVIDPSSDWLYISTLISLIAYDTTWSHNGWEKQWAYSMATGGINYEGHGMKLYNSDLYLACFGIKNDTLYNLVRRFTDITNPGGPTEDFYFSDITLQYINGIAIGQDGHIFVTEGGGSYSFHRVVEYDGNGNYVRSFGSLGDKDDQFNCPMDIFIDNSGKIYVVDMGNHCIKVFTK